MSEESDDPLGFGDVVGSVESRIGRSTDRDCDYCGTSEGSVTVDRDEDVARCRECYNDPSTYDVDPEEWDGSD